MIPNAAVIEPQKGKNAPPLRPVAAMVSTEADLAVLGALLNFDEQKFQKLFISKLFFDMQANQGVALTGPLIGAPYAAMLLETLIARGARRIIFLGWCGAISEKARVGDIILPTSAIIDEGTSKHYAPGNIYSRPSDALVAKARQLLGANTLNFHEGVIWSTDAIYRETREKVVYFQKKDVLAVEMETSALFTVARFREVELGAILVVSDELSTGQWRPGFKDQHFKQARMGACRLVKELCQTL